MENKSIYHLVQKGLRVNMRTTLYDLREVNLNKRRPIDFTSDDMWQDYFSQMKSLVQPSAKKKMDTIRETTSDPNCYHGQTNEAYYRVYINSILKNIRSGKEDFCYFVYQIADLLKYEPDLHTEFIPDGEYFVVSLPCYGLRKHRERK